MNEHDKILEQIAKLIHSGKWPQGTASTDMIKEVAQILFKEVKIGYNKGLSITEQDPEFILQLKQNTYVFSGFRSHQQIKEISALLTDGDRVRSFSEFLKAVKKTDKVWNEVYLATERDHALTTATMIGKWKTIQAEKDVLPWLRYETVGDSRVRAKHAKLDGITRRVSDSFWDKHYPPNDWNCRCTVKQLSDAEATDLSKFEPPILNPMFETNAGKQGVVFPEKHPYFKDAEKDRVKIIRQSTLSMPRADQFRRIKDYGKGTVDEHVLVNHKASDYKQVSTVAIEFAMQFKEQMEVLPIIHENDTDTRDEVLPNANKNKNPDLRAGLKYIEVESYIDGVDHDKLQQAVNRGSKQAAHVVLYMRHRYDENQLHSFAKERLRVLDKLTEITIRTIDGKYINYVK